MAATNRRHFLQGSLGVVAGIGLGCAAEDEAGDDSVNPGAESAETAASSGSDRFRISVAEWSYYRDLFGEGLTRFTDWDALAAALREDSSQVLVGSLDHLDFPAKARSHGIDGVEYVNTFFFDKARDEAYLKELASRCDGEGVQSVLIMCDNEGFMGDPDETRRIASVQAHEKWVEAAAFLGCHSVRVNAYSQGTPEEQRDLVSDGLTRLCEFADGYDIDVLVENHGGISSNGAWLASVMEQVNHPRIGTLPDFGNFLISERGAEPEEWYDRYQGVEELMPHARAVSAKSYDFDENGDDTRTDFARMMQIVADAGYSGWVGIEYEGSTLSADEGVAATKRLLERSFTQLG